MSLRNYVRDENQKARKESLWRSLKTLESSNASRVRFEDRDYLNFSSNDYLGYSCHPDVIEAAARALKKYGTGGRSSRLISGSLELHRELEEKLAAFKKTEAALLFPTGFMANLGVVCALLGDGDAVILDRLNHASLIDAAKLSRCRVFVYDHASPESLEKVLRRTRPYKKRLVVTDSLFSMDGDLAPLPEISGLCEKHGAWLMIDDAHATGVLGKNGIGAAEHWGVLGKVPIVMGTLSKALGSQGGFVCGPKELIDFLVNKARSFIYTTALSPASCAAALAALELVPREPAKREKLLALSDKLRNDFKKRFGGESTLLKGPATPIVPFLTGSAERTLALSKTLLADGIFVPAIRPPTVPKNECRLRFSLTSDHTEGQIEKLLESLSQSSSGLRPPSPFQGEGIRSR